ncbi:hypothetical protein HYE82_11615 [Streptomyces sp. BR123]|uniref:hypothetical protein n=1 Tax=Streptomyces sp. BR123 TaxID=2749828 RepID=UPI0015C48199|nr:hypothetical protein [Streptomyces sp. BR123]NXY95033.1 hypothetical protein [Streptomyces sp. BR123]
MTTPSPARPFRRCAGWAAALAAALLAIPALGAPAHAAPGDPATASSFNLKPGPDLHGHVADLKAALPTQGVQDLLDQGNRVAKTGASCTADPFGTGDNGTVLAPARKLCWDSGDADTQEWIPQGITGVSDAQADELWGTRKPLVTSWYDKAGARGVRLSFLDPETPVPGDPDGRRYRHVLLVEPYYNSYGNASYRAVDVHAGGIAWYKYHLYVADTLNGLRVFDLRDILDLNPDRDASVDDTTLDGLKSNVRDETRIGRQSNVYYSHTYRYVLPQVASYKFAAAQGNTSAGTCVATGAPKASYISIDRSDTAAPALIMGEYCDSDTDHPEKGRVGALPIDDATGLLKTTGGVVAATSAYHLPRDLTQGAARYEGTYYFNRSWTDHSGSLRRATVTGGRLVDLGDNITNAVGPEDLYLEHGQSVPGGGTRYLWSLTEHRADVTPGCTDTGSPCGRVVYAHRLSDVLARP